MKRLNRNMHGDDPTFHRLPDDAALAAQYLLLYELSVPFGADLNDRIDVAKSATRLTATMRGLTARGMLELDARAQGWLDANVPEFADKATGMAVIFANRAQRNVQSMLLGTTVGMALLSFILIPGVQECAPGPCEPRAQLPARGHVLRPVGLRSRPRGAVRRRGHRPLPSESSSTTQFTS